MPLVLAAVALVGCGDSGFDPPSIVMGPRVLATIAEPPEAPPGVDVTLTPVLAGAEGHTVEASVDLSVRALAAAAGQTLGEPGERMSLAEVDGALVLDGDATRAAMDALEATIADAPAGTPEAVVRRVYEDVGLTLPVSVTLRGPDGEVVLEAFKRITLTERDAPTTNPPPPRFVIGSTEVVGDGAGACAAEGDPPRVPVGVEVTLAPDPGDGAWLETYPILDLDGAVVPGMENAYYSWFSTGGEFSFAVTRAPERAVIWTTPELPGTVPLWLVVRDGHLGTSACRVDVIVE